MGTKMKKGILRPIQFITKIFGTELDRTNLSLLFFSFYTEHTLQPSTFSKSKIPSFIFLDSKEEEIEIQIGLPTDVKHLAHIGFHGPETTGPSWVRFIFLKTIYILS